MSVALNPSSTLGFNRPLTQHVKRTLTISNHNAQPVAFKVKTTAPKLYCVRPNSGRVEPGESVEVQVMLQAMREEPPLAAKCKDKFLIQSTLIPPEKDSLSLQDIWNADPPEEIHSQKIRVAYLPPEGQTVPEEEEPHVPAVVAEPPAATTSGMDGYVTVATHQPEPAPAIPDFSERDVQPAEPEIHVDAPSTPPPEPPVEEEEPVLEDAPERPAVVNVNVHTPSAPAPAPVPPPAPIVVPDPNPELVAKLHDAYAEIERLRNLISAIPDPSTVPTSTGISASAVPTERTDLRRRRNRVPSDDASTYVGSDVTSYAGDNMTQPDGVPLQIVIIVALGVFTMTYLFF